MVERDAFFLERHPCDDVRDALIERCAGVEIERLFRGERHGERVWLRRANKAAGGHEHDRQ